ncbi:histidine kinase [Bacillus firmus]|uniref:sensor histidine kinase n=1 Tax=Cytobacillus firmus TaxID=1399 RepID=UPI001580C2C8|nr:histidine kinase [Cytobacillus firmus]NUH83300.1 histidine kinase [Cytobacillus firmus]
MLITYETFSLFAIFSIFVPMAGAIILMMVLAFEKQIDTLSFEKQQAVLENTLQESKYMQLNQQIHPHFLFNTINLMLGLARLNRIDTLIKAMETLSLFLKFKYQIKEQLIPLKKEWEYTKYYLKIQELRFHNRLTITEDIDEDALKHYVPPYLLQTLVENSFKHGLEKKPGPLSLSIKAVSHKDSITLYVEDNGLGIGDYSFEDMLAKGQGLSNVKKRLDLLFQTSDLDIFKNEQDGATVKITLPKVELQEEEQA